VAREKFDGSPYFTPNRRSMHPALGGAKETKKRWNEVVSSDSKPIHVIRAVSSTAISNLGRLPGRTPRRGSRFAAMLFDTPFLDTADRNEPEALAEFV